MVLHENQRKGEAFLRRAERRHGDQMVQSPVPDRNDVSQRPNFFLLIHNLFLILGHKPYARLKFHSRGKRVC